MAPQFLFFVHIPTDFGKEVGLIAYLVTPEIEVWKNLVQVFALGQAVPERIHTPCPVWVQDSALLRNSIRLALEP